MSRLGQGSDTTACPWCEGNIDPSGGYFSKLDDNHKSHNFQGFTIFSQFSRSPGRLLNHEWAKPRKTRKKLRTTNGHEWTRKESRGLLNHEWARKESRGLLNHEWARISVVRGLLPSLACGLSSTVDGMQCAISSQFAHLPSGESRDGVGILVVDGVSAARCERSPR